jgi:hypothetical protein
MAKIINLLQPLNVTFKDPHTAPEIKGQDCQIYIKFDRPKEGEEPLVIVEVHEADRIVQSQKLSAGSTCTVQLTRSMRHFVAGGKPLEIT